MPVHRIKSFAKVQLEYDGRDTPLMTALDDLSRINKVLSDAAPFDEASLIRVHKLRDEGLQAKCHAFSANLGDAILQGDRPVVFCQK